MASVFVIADILTDAARMANVPAFAADTNVTTTMATYWVVQGARTFTARLRSAFGEDADYLREATITSQAGINTVSLPPDAGEVHSVLWCRTASDYRLLRNGTQDRLVDLQEGNPMPWREFGEPSFRLEGETLAFYPPSSEAENLIVFYTSHLKLGGQTYFSARLDTDRWLALDVAVRVLQSQGRDPTVLTQDKLMLEAQVFNPSRGRQPNRVVTIRNTGAERAMASWRDRWSR
jgi:hypothetical protein